MPGKLTVRALVAVYLDSVQLRAKCGRLDSDYAGLIDRYCRDFAQAFGDRHFEQCTPDDLTRWLLDRPSWSSDSTRLNALNSVIGAFNWLADARRLIPYSPYKRPKELRIRPKPRQPISTDEYQLLMHAARNRTGRRRRPAAAALRCAVYFLWRSGCRTCEMRNALRQDVHTIDGESVVVLDRHKTDASGEQRRFGLDARLVRLLGIIERRRSPNQRPCRCEEAEHRPHAEGDHLFLNSRGRPWDRGSFGKLFRAFARIAGIPARKTAYCLRHGFCVRSLHKGIGEREIAHQMGHADTKLIGWYGRQAGLKASYLCSVARRAND